MEELLKILEENKINEEELLKLLKNNRNKYKGLAIEEVIKEYEEELRHNQLSNSTIRDYLRIVNEFVTFNGIKTIEDITQEKHIKYNQYLKEEKEDARKQPKKEESKKKNKEVPKGQKTSSTNRSIVIINKFLYFVGCGDSTIKQERVQRKTNNENVFTKKEFDRLVEYALKTDKIKQAQKELAQAETKEEKAQAQKKLNKAIKEYRKKYDTIHIIIAIFGTGIRDNEIKFLTKEAVIKGEMKITNKGKTREVPIPQWVKKILLNYCSNKGIEQGIIFYGRDKETRLSHSQIWRNIQWLVGQARIKKDKAHEHSFRGLMAKEYMIQTNNDRERTTRHFRTRKFGDSRNIYPKNKERTKTRYAKNEYK